MTRWLQTDFAHRPRPLWRRLQTWWVSWTGTAPAVTHPALDQDTVWHELRHSLVTAIGPDFTSFDPAVNPYVYTGIAPLDPTALMGESDRFGYGGGSGHHSSSLSVFRHDD